MTKGAGLAQSTAAWVILVGAQKENRRGEESGKHALASPHSVSGKICDYTYFPASRLSPPRPTVLLAERGVRSKAKEELKAPAELEKEQAVTNGSQEGGWKAWQHFLIDLLSESITGATHAREDRLWTHLSSSPSKQSMCVAFFFTSIFTPDCWALPLKVATLNITSRNVQQESTHGEELTKSGNCLGWAHGNTEISLTL